MWITSRSLTFTSQFIAPLGSFQCPFTSLAYNSHFLITSRKLITIQALCHTCLGRLASCFGICYGFRFTSTYAPVIIHRFWIARCTGMWTTRTRWVGKACGRCWCGWLRHGILCHWIEFVPWARQIWLHLLKLLRNGIIILTVWNWVVMKKKQQHRYDMVSVVRLTFNLFMAIAECVLQQIGYCCVVMPFFVITSIIKCMPDAWNSFFLVQGDYIRHIKNNAYCYSQFTPSLSYGRLRLINCFQYKTGLVMKISSGPRAVQIRQEMIDSYVVRSDCHDHTSIAL